VLLIDAEDDGLGEAVGLGQELGQVPGDRLGAGAERHDPLEVPGVILVVGDGSAVAVQLVLARAPAGRVPLGDHAMHPVGREEAVVDPLSETVLVDRVPEVQIGVAGLLAQRRGGHPELDRRLEVLQDDPPGTLVPRAPAVALVHDDEVEEVGREGPEEPHAALVLGERLVDPEVHLPALDPLARLDLAPRIAEFREEAVLGLVDEDVPVGEVEDPGTAMLARSIPAACPELPADLERHRGLSRAGRHRHEQAAPAGQDRLYHAVDRDLLVVALALADHMVEGREQLTGLGVAEAGCPPVAAPEVFGRRIVRPAPLAPGEEVELEDLLPVGRVGELEPEHRRVVLRLLEAVGRQLVVGLGLDDRQWEVARVAQQVVDALGWPADEPLARRHDAPIGDRPLLGDRVRLGLPARGLQLGDDELPAGVGFVHPPPGAERAGSSGRPERLPSVSMAEGGSRIYRQSSETTSRYASIAAG